MPGFTVDGIDHWAMYEAVAVAVERARNGDGPTLLECKTFRFLGHATAEQPATMQADISAELADAQAFGIASEFPSTDELRCDVFATEMPRNHQTLEFGA